jgi:phosphoglycerate kinase
VLENLGFHVGESANDEKLARELASFADVYINESPRTLHLITASVVSVPRFVAKRGCGLVLEKELSALAGITGKIERPFVAVIGGTHFSSKLPLLTHFLERADTVMVGGAMANTLVASQGKKLGTSKVEEARFPLARDLLAKAKANGIRLLLPVDFVIAEGPNEAPIGEVSAEDVPADAAALDIGPKTRAAFKDAISRAATIFWNGPMGIFESEHFSAGTLSVARAVAGSSAFSMVGGEDSAEAVYRTGLEKGFNHVSSGGRASLEFLEGKVLPGIGALESTSK